MSAPAAQLVYFLRTALRGLAASPVTSAVAVVTIGVSLVLVGAFALLLRNMEELLDRFGDDLHVTAYLEAELDEAARRELVGVAGTVEGVERVRLVTEAEALERFREGVGRGAAFLEGLEENPLPASLEITLVPERRSADGMRVVVESLSGLSGIDDLSSGQDWVEGYLRAVALVRGMGIGPASILILATLLIIANTIRLTAISLDRRNRKVSLQLQNVAEDPNFGGLVEAALGSPATSRTDFWGEAVRTGSRTCTCDPQHKIQLLISLVPATSSSRITEPSFRSLIFWELCQTFSLKYPAALGVKCSLMCTGCP